MTIQTSIPDLVFSSALPDVVVNANASEVTIELGDEDEPLCFYSCNLFSFEKPYHDLLFLPHRIICRFNGWHGVYPECPFIMLTTLDEHQDAKKVTVDNRNSASENP